MSIKITAPCQYLFGEKAEILFPKETSSVVNQSLSKLMKIVDHLLLKNPDALFLFDPDAFNNQCHLYSLFAVQAVNQAKRQNAVDEAMPSMHPLAKGIIEEYTECIDRRFSYHSFFLSHAFLTDIKLLKNLSIKVLTMMGETPDKAFLLFLQDIGGFRTRASRLALNHLFEKQIKEISSSGNPLSCELSKMAKENLQLSPSNGRGMPLYTFPKFAGVTCFLDIISKESVPLFFKVKVVAGEGVGSFVFYNAKPLDLKEPVVVFEMIIAGDSLSPTACEEGAKRCPHHSQRNCRFEQRHAPTAHCTFCSPKKIDLSPYLKKFQPLFEKPEEMLLALGADFVLQCQALLRPLFCDSAKYPRLAASFQASVPKIKSLCLSRSDSLNMSVFHCYADSAARALQNDLVMDDCYESHIAKRGLV